MNCLLAAESPPTLCSSALYYSHNSTSPGKQKIATFRGAHSIEIWRYSFIHSVSQWDKHWRRRTAACVCVCVFVGAAVLQNCTEQPSQGSSLSGSSSNTFLGATNTVSGSLTFIFLFIFFFFNFFFFTASSISNCIFFFFFAAPFQSPLIVREDRQRRRKENRKEESRCALWFVGSVVVAVASSASSLN